MRTQLQLEAFNVWLKDEWSVYASHANVRSQPLCLEIKVGEPGVRVRRAGVTIYEGKCYLQAIKVFNENLSGTVND